MNAPVLMTFSPSLVLCLRDALLHPLWRTLERIGIVRLGRLDQYPPRPLKRETFPPPTLAEASLPTVAMVVPSFQQAELLGRTLESLFLQRYPKLIATVQDGGSRDGTLQVLEQFSGQLAGFVSESDAGQADAIVKGFARVDGEIMGWLNSDDMLMPGALRYVGEYFASHADVDAIYGHRVMIDSHDREIGRWVMPPHEDEALRWIDYVPQETLFWRKSLWDKIGGVNPRFQFALDWDLLLRFRAARATIRRLPYFLGCFRVHSAQKTQSQKPIGLAEITELQIREHGRPAKTDEIEYWARKTQLRAAWSAGLLALGIRC